MVAPAIAMRLMSEEFRAGTIEPLMAAPISDWAIVIGKYLGGVAFLLTLLAPTLLYVALLEWLSDPDYGPILAGYLGLTLLGMLYIAVGLLVSSLTRSTVVALLLMKEREELSREEGAVLLVLFALYLALRVRMGT